ncbi:MAG: serine/threonine-protein phosphatase [Phycisphaeraceae bacterium]|nr:serine/threonine-protein phosphatase [Phycisphaeraceae bacterium]
MSAKQEDAALHEFDQQIEQNRRLWLRTRFLWYGSLVILLTLVDIGLLLLNIWERSTMAGTPHADLPTWILAWRIVLFGGAMFYVARASLETGQVIRLASWLIVLTVISSLIGEDYGLKPRGGLVIRPSHETWNILQAFVLTHFLACLLLPLTPREAIRPILPLSLLYLLIIVSVEFEGVSNLVALVLAPFLGLPGLAVCWVRYSSFRQELRQRLTRVQYVQLRKELSWARRLHESMFPKPILAGPIRFAYLYEPMRQIGGDFVFIHRHLPLRKPPPPATLPVPPAESEESGPSKSDVDRPPARTTAIEVTCDPVEQPPAPDSSPADSHRLTMVVLDVTGHGVPSAITVSRLAGELERIFAEQPDIDPAGMLKLLNRYIRLTIARHHIYATAFAATIAAGSRRLTYAGAGHPAGLLYRDEDGRMTRLESTAGMLGLFEDDEFDCRSLHHTIEPGDVLLAYTDGLTEVRDEKGSQLGHETFSRWAMRILSGFRGRGVPLERQLKELLKMVQDVRPGPPEDDTLLVGLTLKR